MLQERELREHKRPGVLEQMLLELSQATTAAGSNAPSVSSSPQALLHCAVWAALLESGSR